MAQKWLELDFVKRHAIAAIEYALECKRRNLGYFYSGYVETLGFESPLEVAFFMWWYAVSDERNYETECLLKHQHPVEVKNEKFRPDFVILPADSTLADSAARLHLPMPLVAVELDGHDFHERTKEQVSYRDRRDRLLQGSGWTVLHFSGSEFHRRPMECVDEAYSAAHAAFWSLRHRIAAIQRERMTPEERERERQWLDGITKPGDQGSE